jgi:hypothetical protein
MAKRMILLIVVLLGAACHGQGALPVVYGSDPVDVSLVRLIASPDEYNGKLVRLIGFCHLEFEGNALYLHEEDYTRGIAKNGVWLSVGWPVPEKWRSLNNQYVIVEATFDASSLGHLGSFSGSLKDVRRLDRWPSSAEVERMLRPSK